MSKKVLVISSSLRNNSNSEILAKQAAKGAQDAGHDVEFITLKEGLSCLSENHEMCYQGRCF